MALAAPTWAYRDNFQKVTFSIPKKARDCTQVARKRFKQLQ